MFVVDALPLELIGMNSAMTCNYIKFCADQLLIAFGCRRLYKVGNPFEWIETISLQGKTSKRQASSKKCLRKTQNWVLELTAQTKRLFLTPVFNGNEHTQMQMYTTQIKKYLAIPPSLTHICFRFRGFTKTNTNHDVNRGHNKVQ